MQIIAGLGNIGKRYEKTYHNAGFEVIDSLAHSLNAGKFFSSCDAMISECIYCGEQLILAKPQTFMNLSGIAIQKLLKHYKLKPDSLIVVFDDIDIERGRVRKRMSGSGGTHNGMRNIIDVLGTTEFRRVRVGIGRPIEGEMLADYVLSRIDDDALPVIAEAVNDACRAVLELVEGKF